MMRVTIEKAGINGEGIAYLDQKPVFIDGVLPTEVVEIELTQSTPTYHRGKVLRRISDHPKRIVPPCPVQAECGGCALMIAEIEIQHALKLEHLKQSLRKYVGRLDFRLIKPLVVNPQPLGYRNQFKLPVQTEDGRLVAGLYAPSNVWSMIRDWRPSNPRSYGSWNATAKQPLTSPRNGGSEPSSCAVLTANTN
jgi:23S rRNA (uracil1939-C5)-methyltransferase